MNDMHLPMANSAAIECKRIYIDVVRLSEQETKLK